MSYGLEQLEALRKDVHPCFAVDVGDLDQIVARVNLERHRLSVFDGTYLDDVLPKLEWWLALGELILFCASERAAVVPSPEIAKFKRKFVRLADDALYYHSAVWTKELDMSTIPDDVLVAEFQRRNNSRNAKRLSDRTDAALDLLANYRRLTRHVRDFAKRLWPEVDLGWLYAQA